MYKYVLEISANNDAFSRYPEQEVARILRKAADEAEAGAVNIRLFDINGNKVGFLRLEEEEPDE